MFFLRDLPTPAMIQQYVSDHLAVDSVSEALIVMRRGSLLVREVDRYFESDGFSQLRFLVLIVIDREPERDWLTPGDLAARIDVSKPVLARTIAMLIDAGLLQSTPAPDDARCKQLRLTKVGQERLIGLLPGYFKILTAAYQGLEQ